MFKKIINFYLSNKVNKTLLYYIVSTHTIVFSVAVCVIGIGYCFMYIIQTISMFAALIFVLIITLTVISTLIAINEYHNHKRIR